MAVRIVIAEDEALIRLDLQETLEEEGYEVVGAVGRGDHAVELVRELSPDLAILDIMMPGMDGITAAQEITKRRWAAVLILSAHSQRDLFKRARNAGVFGYLVKPFQKNDLVPAIELALGRFADLRIVEAAMKDAKDEIAAHRLVARAVAILMDSGKLTESAAFSLIQKTAMRQRVKKRDIAQQIVEGTWVTTPQPHQGWSPACRRQGCEPRLSRA